MINIGKLYKIGIWCILYCRQRFTFFLFTDQRVFRHDGHLCSIKLTSNGTIILLF